MGRNNGTAAATMTDNHASGGDERLRALDLAIGQIEKQFGRGTIMGLGGSAAYIDVEHAKDPTFSSAIGINIEDLLISQPDTGEQALEICEALVRSNAVDVVVVDSVAALVPRAESAA